MARIAFSPKMLLPVGAVVALAVVTFGLGTTSMDAMLLRPGKLKPVNAGLAKIVPSAAEQEQASDAAKPNLVVAGGGLSEEEITSDPTIARKFVLPEPVIEPQDAQVEMVLAAKSFFTWH